MTATMSLGAPRRALPIVAVLGTGMAAALTIIVASALGTAGFNVWAGVAVGLVLFIGSIPLIVVVTRAAGEPELAPLFIAALAAKFSAALLRYYVSFEVYTSSDAQGYHSAGAVLAPRFREGIFSTDILTRGGSPGSKFMRTLTGAIYTVTGPTKIGGFLVFTWLGFWGLYLSYRAFRIAVPMGNRRRYAALLFFLPTALYWSSSIGKDAWLTFAIGLAAYGSARLLTGRLWGLAPLALGLTAASTVRAHVAVLLGIALLVAFAVTRTTAPNASRLSKRVFVVALLLAFSTVVFANAREQLGTSSLTPSAIETELDVRSLNTAEGGSQFEPARVQSPLDFPIAAFTVLFRPMPYEVHNGTALAASLEGLFLLGLVASSHRRLRNIPSLLRDVPYLAFALTFIAGFVVGFSIIGNFGILARERIQVLPFLLVLVAIPPRPKPAPPSGVTWRPVAAGAPQELTA